jgi:hypothetical protein
MLGNLHTLIYKMKAGEHSSLGGSEYPPLPDVHLKEVYVKVSYK